MQGLPPLTTGNEEAPGFVPVNKHLALDYLEPHLAAIFGKPKRKRGLKLEYVNKFGDWRILTDISLGSRWGSEVRYEHTIKRTDYPKSGLHPFSRRTLASLWGISSGGWWDIPSPQDVEPVTNSLATVCRHFMKEFPPLLTGLDCAD